MSNVISVPAWYLSLDPLAGYDPYNTDAYVLGSAAFQRLRSIAETAETGSSAAAALPECRRPALPALDVHSGVEKHQLIGKFCCNDVQHDANGYSGTGCDSGDSSDDDSLNDIVSNAQPHPLICQSVADGFICCTGDANNNGLPCMCKGEKVCKGFKAACIAEGGQYSGVSWFGVCEEPGVS